MHGEGSSVGVTTFDGERVELRGSYYNIYDIYIYFEG